MTVVGSTFSGNSANYGGGILSEGTQGSAILTVSASTFSENSASENGGGILNNCGTLTISDSTFAGNWASLAGGIYNEGLNGTSTVTVSGSTFSENSANNNGGGILNNYGTLEVFDSTFSNNWANYGGGILNNGRDGAATLTVSASTFSENSAAENGGGILNYCGATTVSESTFAGNWASFGGGVFNNGFYGPATMDISGSMFLENAVYQDGGAIDNNYGTLMVSDSILSDNYATNSGGGIANYSGVTTVSNSTLYRNSANNGGGIIGHGLDGTATTTLSDVTFSENSATEQGGGFLNIGATATATNLILWGNSAEYGGGILNESSDTTEAILTISASSFWENLAGSNGGGLANYKATATLSNTTFECNTSRFGGGIINDGQYGPATMTITDSTISENTASESGGGILNHLGAVIVSSSMFLGNSAHFGGGIINDGKISPATLTVLDSTFAGNSATDAGGGLYNDEGSTDVFGSTFSRNLAVTGGGGIFNSRGTMTIANSIITGNRASFGAGIFSDGKNGSATMNVINSVLFGNSASIGAGILNDGFNSIARLTVANSTVAGNHASSKGGGILNNCSLVSTTLHNTIVASNIAISEPDIALEDNGTISGSHNLIGNGSSQASLVHGSDGNIIGTTESPIDPRFVRTPSDGGDGWGDDIDTPGIDESANDDYGDLWLMLDSPAIDAGSDAMAVDADGNQLIVDLSGGPRIRYEHVDMGAYEYTPLVDVFAVIVTEPNPLDANGESESLPAETNWIDEWQPFYVEVWVNTPATGDMGVASAYVDLKYNTEYHTATQIEYGAGFEMSHGGTIEDVTGTVAGLGAATSQADIGDDGHALLARVRFEPTANDVGVPFAINDSYVPEVYNQIGLEIMQYGLRGTEECETRLTHLPATRLMAVPYDLDNNGAIGLGDLAIFASVYREQPGVSTNDPKAWAADFDHSGTVDLGDLAFFASNYRLCSPSDSITYPNGFVDLGSENSQSASATGTQTEGLGLIEAHWAESTSGVFTADNFSDFTLVNNTNATILAANWTAVAQNQDDEDEARMSVFADLGASGDLLGLLD